MGGKGSSLLNFGVSKLGREEVSDTSKTYICIYRLERWEQH